MRIDCITFDLDDTLWETGSVLTRAEASFFEWITEHCPRVVESHDIDSLADQRRSHYAGIPELRHDVTRARRHWLEHTLREFGYHDDALVDAGFQRFWEARQQVTVFEDVPALLGALRPRFRVGAITNGNADVHHIGIGHLFDFVITAGDAGAAKPEPAIFEAALAAAGAAAEHTVHVGDDPLRDVVGAGRLGMRTVWINPRLDPWPGGRNPDAVVRHVRELAELLERWSA
ncbi:MAG: HAD family hydrolase [Ectothiorhodospiraceae bacterium]|nr:HAD family hydrolase [Chromatiales bacterium]MCP5157578.1 HAD family hydrolase [Ectothiorhodospiraceae bacterium]